MIHSTSMVKEHLADDSGFMLLHEGFEKQVEKSPDQTALIFEGKSLSYHELNARANVVARHLKANGVAVGSIVAIMMQRSFEMIVGLLSVLKAGGTYLPIDPDYPEDRINYILVDSKASLVLTNGEFHENIMQKVLKLEDLNSDMISTNLETSATPGDLSYIIYTSGSTGKPKGVMIEHKSIVNTIQWRRGYYQFDESDTILQLPSVSFDSSVEDIFTALSSASKLVLITEADKLNLKHLEKMIRDHEVTHFLTVPSFYKTLLQDAYKSFRRIKSITIAGESFTSHLVQEHFNKVPHIRLVNEYGPTENSVCSTVYEFSKLQTNVMIGKPINNVTCYVLDQSGTQVPMGEEGELCISGTGLARGYLHHSQLTEEKFVENPFQAGGRMYKTGDLVKVKQDGNLEFLGRIDHQIKIRGFRVELGEIEFWLQSYDKIEDAVVAAREDEYGSHYLCAFYLSEQELDAQDITPFLLQVIPDFMIPKYFVKIDQIPITPNGKTDRDALPVPHTKNDILSEVNALEVNENSSVELRLMKLISESVTLNAPIEFIQPGEKLKTIGVDSLGYIKLMAKIETEFDIEFDYDDMDQLIHPTILDLITFIKKKTN